MNNQVLFLSETCCVNKLPRLLQAIQDGIGAAFIAEYCMACRETGVVADLVEMNLDEWKLEDVRKFCATTGFPLIILTTEEEREAFSARFALGHSVKSIAAIQAQLR